MFLLSCGDVGEARSELGSRKLGKVPVATVRDWVKKAPYNLSEGESVGAYVVPIDLTLQSVEMPDVLSPEGIWQDFYDPEMLLPTLLAPHAIAYYTDGTQDVLQAHQPYIPKVNITMPEGAYAVPDTSLDWWASGANRYGRNSRQCMTKLGSTPTYIEPFLLWAFAPTFEWLWTWPADDLYWAYDPDHTIYHMFSQAVLQVGTSSLAPWPNWKNYIDYATTPIKNISYYEFYWDTISFYANNPDSPVIVFPTPVSSDDTNQRRRVFTYEPGGDSGGAGASGFWSLMSGDFWDYDLTSGVPLLNKEYRRLTNQQEEALCH